MFIIVTLFAFPSLHLKCTETWPSIEFNYLVCLFLHCQCTCNLVSWQNVGIFIDKIFNNKEKIP